MSETTGPANNGAAARPAQVAESGVPPVLKPQTAREVAEIVAEAGKRGSAVAPAGGGTHAALGNPLTRDHWIVDLRGLDRVLAHEPADMTLSVEAGRTLANAQRQLAGSNQMLPIEVSDPDRATIGGILASALYGPKRLGWGTLRDYLIGIEVAYADGSLAKAGGMVVKNVSGFDLMRMHHGAMGTLGIIVSANFKVLPRPRSERTVQFETDNLDELDLATTRVMHGRARPSAFEVSIGGSSVTGWARFEGRERTVGIVVTELANALGGIATLLEPDASQQFWSEFNAEFDASFRTSQCWLRLRSTPAAAIAMASRAREILTSFRVGNDVLNVSPGIGSIDLRFGADELGPDVLAALTSRLREMVPSTTLVAAPVALRDSVDAWGNAVESLDLMKQLKQEFDPQGILNPGRFAGGL